MKITNRRVGKLNGTFTVRRNRVIVQRPVNIGNSAPPGAALSNRISGEEQGGRAA
jgi:hypothetical protein